VDAGRVGSSKADTNAGGPVQEYVAPATVFDVRFIVAPEHTGELLPAVGAAGIGFTTTTIVPAGPAQPTTVAVTLYVPDANTVAPTIDGFCNAELKLFGPVQEYVAPAIKLAVKFKVLPSQIGPLLPAVGAIGVGFTTTRVVAGELEQPLFATTVYVPDASNVVLAMNGF
jgi:hypothetical protein